MPKGVLHTISLIGHSIDIGATKVLCTTSSLELPSTNTPSVVNIKTGYCPKLRSVTSSLSRSFPQERYHYQLYILSPWRKDKRIIHLTHKYPISLPLTFIAYLLILPFSSTQCSTSTARGAPLDGPSPVHPQVEGITSPLDSEYFWNIT